MTTVIPDQEPSLPQGFTLQGRYQIQKELGRGGIGVVYLASDEQLLSRQVVIKVIHDHYFRNEWVERKFRHEMEALSRIDHPGVVSILDSGQMEDGKPYLVMQYVNGILLRDLIEPQGMNFTRASNLLLQMGEALDTAHSKGVWHRDLKPENIMVQELGEGKDQIKLIDFGLAKVIESQTSNSTAMPVVAGSFGYMSPEQLSAKPLTPASDIYSLAVIAHEMITGSRPFVPTSVFELYHLQQKGLARKPATHRKDLPEVAEIVLAKALSFQPENRHQSAGEFTDQIAGALQGKILTLPFTAPAIFQYSLEQNFWSHALPWLASILFVFSFGFALKNWMFLFSNWSTFLSDRITIFTLYPLILLLIMGLLNKSYLRRDGRLRTSILTLVLVISIFLLASKLFLPSVISISSIPGHEVSSKDFFLNYSDPKGYKYTIEDRTFVVQLNPVGWNELHDYSVEITLSPEIEFADLYLDKRFHFFQQLTLQSSATNDIIRFEKTGDHFNTKREIAFTSKFRREPKSKIVRVTLKSSGTEFSYEKNNP